MITPTSTEQWEACLQSPPEETLEHCLELQAMEHLQPLFKVLPPRSKVLEAGCGLGQFVYMFASMGHHSVGLDYSSKLVEQASTRGRALTSQLEGNVEWHEGTILELPFEDDSLDCYSSFGVLEHFHAPQQRKILTESFRVLRPGGLLYQYVPYFWSPWTVRREIRYWASRLRPPELVWQKNMRRSIVRKLCREARFEELSCQSVYAHVALQSMALPSPLAKILPKSIRLAAKRASIHLGHWCDKHDMLGYGIVYVGRKTTGDEHGKT